MEDKQEMEKEISGHKRMKVVFIRANVLFPGQILSFELDKNNDVLRLMEEARAKNEDILVIAEKNPDKEGARARRRLFGWHYRAHYADTAFAQRRRKSRGSRRRANENA